VPSAVAQALGLREAAGERIETTIARFLAPRSMLIVVDNFEQVLPAAPLVATLLKAAPALTVLTTSRARLRLSGEHEFPVSPLPLPDPERDATPELVLEAPAAQLFVERARAAQPDFELTRENAPAVAELCVRVDGLPLALELAAAASKLLPPQAQLARLERRLDALTDGARDLPRRHQTLRETIGWSSDLLPESERTLFARLAVFAGEFGLEAAEAVGGPGHVLGGLMLLVDHSLLLPRPVLETEPRFSILPTIREYAQELLQASGELPSIARRHAEHYLALAERAEPELWGADQAGWLDRLDREQANLRAALTWWRGEEEAEALLRIAIALRRWWSTRGQLSEGLASFDQGLALIAPDAAVRVAGLEGAARLARDIGDTERARELFAAQLGLAEELGDGRGAASALSGLASIASWEGDRERAESLQQRSVELFRELGDEWGQAAGLVDLSDLALYRGDFAAAAGLTEEALELFRRLGDRRAIAISLVNRGFALLALDRPGEAKASLTESLETSAQLGDTLNIVYCVEGLAAAAEGEGEDERAARLLGRAEALRDATGGELPPFEQSIHERTVERVRGRLGEEAYADAVNVGRSEPLERADGLSPAHDAR
jgi:predicted ATPase